MPPKQKKNVTTATAVGIVGGGTGSVIVTYAVNEIERRYGIPAPLTASVLGTLLGFATRWAAKLSPHE